MRENKKETQRKKLPFWIQISLIVLCGIIASGVTYYLIHNKQVADFEAQKPRYTVTFAHQDGSVIDTRHVKEGAGTFPPSYETEGVFQGWSGAFNDVISNTEVHPMTYNITEDENLFCFDAVYVQEGEEFTINVRLDGNVNISSAEIAIEYDGDVMEFVSANAEDRCSVTEQEDGTLLLKLDSKTPVTESVPLANITFLAKEMDVYSTQINLRYISGTFWADGKENPATVSTLNNKIYYLQEVSQ